MPQSQWFYTKLSIQALEVLRKSKGDFEGFVSHRLPLTDAAAAYIAFEARKMQKVVFTMPQ